MSCYGTRKDGKIYDLFSKKEIKGTEADMVKQVVKAKKNEIIGENNYDSIILDVEREQLNKIWGMNFF